MTFAKINSTKQMKTFYLRIYCIQKTDTLILGVNETD